MYCPAPPRPANGSLSNKHLEAAECDCLTASCSRPCDLEDKPIKPSVIITITTKTLHIERRINPTATAKAPDARLSFLHEIPHN
jgi:hypothetical protein